jgi:hypothetical protein
MPDMYTVAGYSANDFYYTNSAYCSTWGTGYNKRTSYINDNLANQEESGYTGSGTIDYNNACNANKFYGDKIVEQNKESQTTSAKYNHSLIVYNRELLRTVNYLAGIGALAVYIYVTQSR